MKILAIDPGSTQSAFVILENGMPKEFDKVDNVQLLQMLRDSKWGLIQMAIEQIASYGMAVGEEIFSTCVWSGRFIEAHQGDFVMIPRKDVKLHLCGSMRAKDANIRARLIDIFGPGRDLAIGKKTQPGPLFRVSGDVWSAIAVAKTAESKLGAV